MTMAKNLRNRDDKYGCAALEQEFERARSMTCSRADSCAHDHADGRAHDHADSRAHDHADGRAHDHADDRAHNHADGRAHGSAHDHTDGSAHNHADGRAHGRVQMGAMCFTMIFALLAPLLFIGGPAAEAAVAPVPDPIRGLIVERGDIALDNQRGMTSLRIGHDIPPPLNDAALTTQDPPGRYSGRVVKYYFDAYNKGYRGKPPIAVFEDARGPTWSLDKFRIDNLPSGTIYDVQATTYARYYENINAPTQQQRSTAESVRTGEILRLFTGVQIDATLVAPDQIKISWDDVWYNDRRIYAYDLNIYTHSSALSPERTMRFTENLIGPGQPVTVNQTAGKLEYTYQVPYPGRVYCFEIVPVMSNVPDVIVPSRNARVTVASTILVSASKLYEGDNMITWEIKWSNVTAGMGAVSIGSRYTAEYSLYKITGGSNYSVLQRIDNENSTIIETPKDPDHPDNLNVRYEILARIFEDGREMYVGESITITSGPFMLREGETPYKPQAPVLRHDADKLTSDGAGLWWNVPKQVNAPLEDDEEVDYEIYILEDSEQLNNLTDSPAYIASGFNIEKGRLNGELGYVYQIPGLSPNTTYYLAVRAVKSFMDIETMAFVRLASELSYVVVTTPPQLPMGQPPAPTTLDIYGDKIQYNSVPLTVKTVWYESFDASTGKWALCDGMFDEHGLPLPESQNYRKLTYAPGDKITVYYAVFSDDMDLDDPDSIQYDSYRTFELTLFNDMEWTDLIVNGLAENTTYVFWAKADRGTVLSFPSKTIVATTPPIPNEEIGNPTVPDFDFVFIGDTYVDMTWQREDNFTYNIQYSLTDDPGALTGQTGASSLVAHSVTTDEITASGLDFYRVTGLTPETMYYFRIQAQVTSPVSGEIKMSEWSDFKPTKTRLPMPPSTPAGFGIKSGADAITKNSIFYEWLQMPGIVYLLEYSTDSDLTEPGNFVDAGAVAEYNLIELLSNHRYYARLYAFDPVTGLRSEPTNVVGARTKRSDDDYDSNVDNTTVLTGEFVEKDPYAINGVWNVRITGPNADRFAERVMTDGMLDYTIDLTSPPRYTVKIRLLVDNKVFDSLDKMRENVELKLRDKSFVIRPRMLSAVAAGGVARRMAKFQYEILLGLEGNDNYEKPANYRLKTTVTSFDVNVLDSGGARLPVESFGKPLKVVAPFTSASFYTDMVTRGIASNSEGVWENLAASAVFDSDTRRGTVTFEYSAPGNFLLADSAGPVITGLGETQYRTYINKLSRADLLDVPPGGNFRGDEPVTPEDAVAMLFKAFGYKFSGSNMTSAYKAGFVTALDFDDMLMEEAVAMVVRAYEVRTGVKADASPGQNGQGGRLSPGVSEVDPVLQGRVQFAIDNSLAGPVMQGGRFPAGTIITRGEMAALIGVMLEYLGML